MHRPALPLFSSFDEELKFLEDHHLNYARGSLLETHSGHYEATELHLSENRLLEAVQAFIKDTSHPDSTARAADIILAYFWRNCSFRANDALVNERLRHFIKLAGQLQTKKLDPLTRTLVCMAEPSAPLN